MFLDIKAYNLHIQMLEIINIFTYAIIIISSTLIGIFIFKKFIFGLMGFLLGILVGYFIYAIGQLKADQHKFQLDLYIKLIQEGK